MSEEHLTLSDETLEEYQKFTEQTIHELSQEIMNLEHKLAMFTNLLEISKYINQYMQDQNLIPLINDMLIGVFGAKYSTIYIKNNSGYEAVTSNTFSYCVEKEKALIEQNNELEFILNKETPVYETDDPKQAIFSCLGVPIKVNDTPLGFILIQHVEKNFFQKEALTFLCSLANHVGVAIENNLLYNQIKESAYKDGLTGIFNKSYFFDTLNAISDLNFRGYTIVMIDIDNFKNVNDTYGHLYGDIVLKRIASIIKSNIRPKDIVARYGGEEIIIYFDHFINKENVFKRVDNIRSQVEQTVIEGDGFISSVTGSFGIYVKLENDTLSLREVIEAADKNLYICKRTGKNKCVINE